MSGFATFRDAGTALGPLPRPAGSRDYSESIQPTPLPQVYLIIAFALLPAAKPPRRLS